MITKNNYEKIFYNNFINTNFKLISELSNILIYSIKIEKNLIFEKLIDALLSPSKINIEFLEKIIYHH